MLNKFKWKIGRVVYFDEESTTDFIQIIAGGQLNKTTELIAGTDKYASAEASAEANIGFGKIFKTLIGISVSSEVDMTTSIASESRKMVSSILNNTILSDFIDVIHNEEFTGIVETFDGYKLSIQKDSLAYIVMVSPFMTMINNSNGTISGDLEISIDKIDTAVKQGKGYYELIGSKGKREVIFRFNIDAFKNNYRISDLLKMKLTLFAIKVGQTKKGNLNFNYELSLGEVNDNNKVDFFQNKITNDKENKERNLDVYDVFFAGVKVNDR